LKQPNLYRFVGTQGDFIAEAADQDRSLYFPLCNELGFLSAITPTLHGDIKLNQNAFLTVPLTTEDLHLSRAGRNFWMTILSEKGGKPQLCWALNGQSPQQKEKRERVTIEGGLLWHRVIRTNTQVGLEAKITNFIPSSAGTFEVMMVEIKNLSKKKRFIQATSAIPLFARSADNLRDHHQVTSLLHRIDKTKYGITVVPTMTFNERGHHVNTLQYYVLGVNETGKGPAGIFPTYQDFAGTAGDFDHPEAIFDGKAAATTISDEHQGKEVMGALQFGPQRLAPGKSTFFTLFLGIGAREEKVDEIAEEHGNRKATLVLLEEMKKNWQIRSERIRFRTADDEFNQWLGWVKVQPTFRKIFGCSFLPDFDYGRGGRGWRDLWQDCLALLLANPDEVRPMIINNFAGVRIDGTNATIIGKKRIIPRETDCGVEYYWEPEFIADRNSITRTWMDHGLWPYVTTELYVHQTGDWDILLEPLSYFQDAQLRRGEKIDRDWNPEVTQLTIANGQPYKGTLLEHILVEHLVPFFNVGDHNTIRLEDADWNDGLDMAPQKGESVAFTHFYGGNLESLAQFLELAQKRKGWHDVSIFEEMLLLLDRVGLKINYDSVADKKTRLEEYFHAVEKGIKGQMTSIPLATLIHDLREKAEWLKNHLNKQEWIEESGYGWFNGYYDNTGERVEGRHRDGQVRMTLTGQVYAIMSETANDDRVRKMIVAVNEFLWDHQLEGIRLNTDFGAIQPNLGRAFSFAYGEKENGAVFSHMMVMYAYALYKRGFVEEGYRALDSLFRLVKNSKQSRIFPGIPEYFNNEGRGRYHYLTGSASWYVYAMLTQVFGARGLGGDLVLAPKLMPHQFNTKGEVEVEFTFAGSRVHLVYRNKRRIPYEQMGLKSVINEKMTVPFTRLNDKEILIQKELLSQRKRWDFLVELETRE